MFIRANTGKTAITFDKPRKYCYPKRLAIERYPEKLM